MTNMGKIAAIHAKLMMTSFLEIMTCFITKKIIATFCWADATNIFKINHFIVNPQYEKKRQSLSHHQMKNFVEAI